MGMKSKTFDMNAIKLIIKYTLEAGRNIYDTIPKFESSGLITCLFDICREAVRGSLRKGTLGHLTFFNAQIKTSIIVAYEFIIKNNLDIYELSEFIEIFAGYWFDYFEYNLTTVMNDDDFFVRTPIMKSKDKFIEHFSEQIICLNAMVKDFGNNYLIPFVIDKTDKEFCDTHEHYLERRMCAILSEDLLLDYNIRSFSAKFNIYSSKKIPTMSHDFRKACDPFYEIIYQELFDKEKLRLFMNIMNTYSTVVKLLNQLPEMYKNCFIDKQKYIWRDKENLSQCLDYIQKITDTFTKTTDVEFNKTLYKLLSCVAAYPLYHFYADEYMDYIAHSGLVPKEIIEFRNIAYFIEEKYIKGSEIYLTAITSNKRLNPLGLDVYVESIGENRSIVLGTFFLAHKNKEILLTVFDEIYKKEFKLKPSHPLSSYRLNGYSNNFSYIENSNIWDDNNWDL